jgi:hypothetical protein
MYSWLPREVSSHDQPQGTIGGHVDAHGCGARPEVLSPLEGQSPGQLGDGLPPRAPDNDHPQVQHPYPDEPQPPYHLGEPPGGAMCVKGDVAGTQPQADDLLEHGPCQMQFGPVGVWGTRAFGPPQAEIDGDAQAAIRTAPQKHHDVQPVDLASLGERLGPACPRQLLCNSFLDHLVVEAEVALLAARFGPGDQEPYQHPDRKGHYPQEPVERIVAATGQKPGDACL